VYERERERERKRKKERKKWGIEDIKHLAHVLKAISVMTLHHSWEGLAESSKGRAMLSNIGYTLQIWLKGFGLSVLVLLDLVFPWLGLPGNGIPGLGLLGFDLLGLCLTYLGLPWLAAFLDLGLQRLAIPRFHLSVLGIPQQ